MTAKGGSFTVLYGAGMAALTLVGALAALILTGERSAGFVGSIEVPVLGIGAVLFAAAGVGAVTSREASWPLLVAVAASILVGVLTFLTFTDPDVSSVVLFELAAVVQGVILAQVIRTR